MVAALSPERSSRQAKGRERRSQLAKVAARLIDKRGFDALSVNEVAEAAGISIGGMYRYIRSKSDLLVMACEDIFAGLKEEMAEAARAEKRVPQKLSAAISVYWRACEERSDLIALTYREFRSLPPDRKAYYQHQELEIVDLLRDLIRAGTITGEFGQVDDRIVAHEILFLSHMVAFKGWALQRASPEERLAEHLALFLARLEPRPATATPP